jgi:hypothetical protein
MSLPVGKTTNDGSVVAIRERIMSRIFHDVADGVVKARRAKTEIALEFNGLALAAITRALSDAVHELLEEMARRDREMLEHVGRVRRDCLRRIGTSAAQVAAKPRGKSR